MYDDLGALADKLKMSNVSFQEINKSEKEVSPAPLPATVNETAQDMPPWQKSVSPGQKAARPHATSLRRFAPHLFAVATASP